mmetsp:Transcript_4682/g.6630  ORF Transcript_4682/g.6630 Transcript_4682/m.6630 type:complete len:409 (-) Transcript_4682:281-1507(-)|eukprot:CAMPEP_0184488022 /NCGR_PEP_ID=MMETSP0113_2-20130426/10479_1 /TAXON_ID=91329 /ORGANISM="Norrisiella sphaerica, Strain BC52" /LENGTH=408 /DNA_ID=CAMNT_0026870485 /DNA_START=234 /DNA_END=1460 /DNA_ORIENTATION=-
MLGRTASTSIGAASRVLSFPILRPSAASKVSSDSKQHYKPPSVRNFLTKARPAKRKIGLVGAGSIGGTLALLSAERGLGDIVLLDSNEKLAKGKALDIEQAQAVTGKDCKVTGTFDYGALENADVVVVTAGMQRQFGPGLSRDNLLDSNSEIAAKVAKELKRVAPHAFVIVVTNPLDAIAYVMHRESGFSKNQVVGMAGVLDTARFRLFLADELGVSRADVSSMVLGGHGDTMTPLVSATTVGGIPLREIVNRGLLSEERLEEIIQRTRDGGAEIGQLMKPLTTYNAPALCVLEMMEAYLFDRKRILPCSALLQGEYGVEDLFIGVPCVIGAGGVEQVIEYNLVGEEVKMFEKSVNAVSKLVGKLQYSSEMQEAEKLSKKAKDSANVDEQGTSPPGQRATARVNPAKI